MAGRFAHLRAEAPTFCDGGGTETPAHWRDAGASADGAGPSHTRTATALAALRAAAARDFAEPRVAARVTSPPPRGAMLHTAVPWFEESREGDGGHGTFTTLSDLLLARAGAADPDRAPRHQQAVAGGPTLLPPLLVKPTAASPTARHATSSIAELRRLRREEQRADGEAVLTSPRSVSRPLARAVAASPLRHDDATIAAGDARPWWEAAGGEVGGFAAYASGIGAGDSGRRRTSDGRLIVAPATQSYDVDGHAAIMAADTLRARTSEGVAAARRERQRRQALAPSVHSVDPPAVAAALGLAMVGDVRRAPAVATVPKYSRYLATFERGLFDVGPPEYMGADGKCMYHRAGETTAMYSSFERDGVFRERWARTAVTKARGVMTSGGGTRMSGGEERSDRGWGELSGSVMEPVSADLASQTQPKASRLLSRHFTTWRPAGRG